MASAFQSAVSTAAAYNQVEITLETIRNLASRHLTDAINEAADSQSTVGGIYNDGNLFGGSPEGRAVASSHGVAIEVFRACVANIEQRLSEMQQGLLDTLRTYADADADAEMVLRRFQAEHPDLTTPPAGENEMAARTYVPDGAAGTTGPTGAAAAPVAPFEGS